MFLVDSHCHLDLLKLATEEDSLEKVLLRAKEQDVKHILNVGVKLAQFEALLRLAQTDDCISISVGLHPNDRSETAALNDLLQKGQHQKVVAIGETGLDYFRSTGDLNWQRERFEVHIQAAKMLKKPLIVHTREAKVDTMSILRTTEAQNCGGVMHCFNEDWDTAKGALDLGFYISFSGIITFKNALHLQEIAKRIPLNRLLIETDAPYLAPHPHRGKQNEPSFLRYTAEYIASLRAIPLEELALQTTHNFFTLFHGAVRSHV